MKTSIALIGFMGTGKTAVGKTLAQKTRKKFIETDALVEQKAGKPISMIFHEDGEVRFRELEIETVKDIAGSQNAVIACGGGVVLNQINIDRLRQESVIVYLTATPTVIMKRTSRDKTVRPLLESTNALQRIREMLKFRRSFYERAADITVNTSRLDVDSVVKEIQAKLKEYNAVDIRQRVNRHK